MTSTIDSETITIEIPSDAASVEALASAISEILGVMEDREQDLDAEREGLGDLVLDALKVGAFLDDTAEALAACETRLAFVTRKVGVLQGVFAQIGDHR